MAIRVLLLHAPEIDPSPAAYVLKNSEKIQAVDCVSGDSALSEAEVAFESGYDVVLTDLVLGYDSTFSVSRDSGLKSTGAEKIYRGKMEFDGLSLIRRSMDMAHATGDQANLVAFTPWDNINNLVECYRIGAKAFISQRHPLRSSVLIDTVVEASKGKVTFPFDDRRTRNMALAVTKQSFSKFTVTELETLTLLVNRLSTQQIQKMIKSKSIKATEVRIGKVVRKLGVADREAVIGYALEVGLEPDNIIQLS